MSGPEAFTIGTAADTAVNVGVEVRDAGLADGAGLTEVGGDGFRQSGQIGLGDDCAREPSGECSLDAMPVFGPVARRTLRGVAIADGDQQHQIGDGAGLGVAP